MRMLLVPTLLLATACSPSALLDADTSQPGATGASATGQYPDIQAVPPRAARQLDAGTYADIQSDLNAQARVAARRGVVDGRSADTRARSLVADAQADAERRRRRIRNTGRVAPAT